MYGMTNEEVIRKIEIADKRFVNDGLLHFGELKSSELTISEFLGMLLEHYNYDYNTLNSDGQVDTYTNLNRSVKDIYRIAKYYYPELSLHDCLCHLYELCYSGRLCILRCMEIGRLTFFSYSRKKYRNAINCPSSALDGSLNLSPEHLAQVFTENYVKQYI